MLAAKKLLQIVLSMPPLPPQKIHKQNIVLRTYAIFGSRALFPFVQSSVDLIFTPTIFLFVQPSVDFQAPLTGDRPSS